MVTTYLCISDIADLILYQKYLTTSVCSDYDAPLSEAGDYTDKYDATCELLEKYQKVKLRKPERPKETKKFAYSSLDTTMYIDWDTLLSQVVSIGFCIEILNASPSAIYEPCLLRPVFHK